MLDIQDKYYAHFVVCKTVNTMDLNDLFEVFQLLVVSSASDSEIIALATRPCYVC